MPWASGQQTDTATATGDYGDTTYNDTDDANYLGVAPSIDVEKDVWDGTIWVDADEVTGPNLASKPVKFRFVVTNTGDVELTNITLADNPIIANLYSDDTLITACVLPTTLDPDGTFTCYGSLPWASGQQTDTATATGDYGDTTYNDTDDAHYLGVGPGITVEKDVWDGTIWVDADEVTGPSLASGPVKFRFVVTNTGDVELTNITLADNPIIANLSSDDTLITACQYWAYRRTGS